MPTLQALLIFAKVFLVINLKSLNYLMNRFNIFYVGCEGWRGALHPLRHLLGQGRHQERLEAGLERGPVVHRKAQERVRRRGEALPQDGRQHGRATRCQLLPRLQLDPQHAYN